MEYVFHIIIMLNIYIMLTLSANLTIGMANLLTMCQADNPKRVETPSRFSSFDIAWSPLPDRYISYMRRTVSASSGSIS